MQELLMKVLQKFLVNCPKSFLQRGIYNETLREFSDSIADENLDTKYRNLCFCLNPKLNIWIFLILDDVF